MVEQGAPTTSGEDRETRAVSLVESIRGLRDIRRTAVRRVEARMDASSVREVFAEMLAKRGHVHLSTISGMDTGQQIDVVYHVDIDGVMVSIFCALDRQKPEIDTIGDMIPGALAPERELYDLLGVVVGGNESPPPLVLPDDWPRGQFPLRKDWKPDREGI